MGTRLTNGAAIKPARLALTDLEPEDDEWEKEDLVLAEIAPRKAGIPLETEIFLDGCEDPSVVNDRERKP